MDNKTRAVEALLQSQDGCSGPQLLVPLAGRPQLRSPSRPLLQAAPRGPLCLAGSQCQQIHSTQLEHLNVDP